MIFCHTPSSGPLGRDLPLHVVAVDFTRTPAPTVEADMLRTHTSSNAMYKIRDFEPNYGSPNQKDEDVPVYVSQDQGWIDNGISPLPG
jgi:hypothetical protein